MVLIIHITNKSISGKYIKCDQQGRAAPNQRNPQTTQQQEPALRSPGVPQTEIGEGARQSTHRIITYMILKKEIITFSHLIVFRKWRHTTYEILTNEILYNKYIKPYLKPI
jgi:hypothetical protein